MFGINWDDFSAQFRGTVLIVGGSILLLHTLGILEKWLNWILVLTALSMIIYGFMLSGLWSKLIATIKRKNN
jgi:hypothetical protein